MSGTESIFFTQYFSILVGNKVGKDDCTWLYYLALHELVHILNAPNFTTGNSLKISEITKNHHELYLLNFGPLKPRFHMLLHYQKLTFQNGLIKLL